MRITCEKGKGFALVIYRDGICKSLAVVRASEYVDIPTFPSCGPPFAYAIDPSKLLIFDTKNCSNLVDSIDYTMPLEEMQLPTFTPDSFPTQSITTKCLVSQSQNHSARFACDKSSATNFGKSFGFTLSVLISLLI
jgi:hypothetical protein